MVTQAILTGDPRTFQIAALSALLCIGVGALQLPLNPLIAAMVVASALLTRRLGFSKPCDLRSALISGLSLCRVMRRYDMLESMVPEDSAAPAPAAARAKSLGVTIEAEDAVGEYDIQILSAEQSSGLLTWLNESGCRVPAGAAPGGRSATL